MNKKKIKNVLVVLGGTSGERAVSLETGKACIRALKKKVIIFPLLIQKLKTSILLIKKI